METSDGPGSEARYEQQLAAGRTVNFAIIAGVHSCWGLGNALISFEALLPVFLQELGASYMVIGALPALMTLAIFGPQVLAALLTSHLPVKKRVFTCVHYPGCAAIFVLGLLTFCWGKSNRDALIVATLVCMSIHGLALSFAVPMWSNLVAKLLPAETRGRSFGHLFLAGGITGVIGSAAASKLIEWQGFPNGFGTGFLVCSVICAGSVSCFFFLREPPHPEPVVQQGLRDFLKGIRQDVLGQRNYRFYLLSQVLAGLGAMAVPFFAVVARNQFTLDVKVGATFTAIVLLGRIIGCPLAGLIGDRHGFRVVAFFPPLLLLVATGLALAVSHAGVFYLIFALVGLARAIDSVAMINLPIEFSPHADKTSFLAVRGTVVSPVQALAPLLGGFLVDAFRGSYVLPFALAIVFNAVCIGVLSLLVHEPRRTARP